MAAVGCQSTKALVRVTNWSLAGKDIGRDDTGPMVVTATGAAMIVDFHVLFEGKDPVSLFVCAQLSLTAPPVNTHVTCGSSNAALTDAWLVIMTTLNRPKRNGLRSAALEFDL